MDQSKSKEAEKAEDEAEVEADDEEAEEAEDLSDDSDNDGLDYVKAEDAVLNDADVAHIVAALKKNGVLGKELVGVMGDEKCGWRSRLFPAKGVLIIMYFMFLFLIK